MNITRAAVLAATGTVALAGAGLGVVLAASSSGAAPPPTPPTVGVDSTGCQETSGPGGHHLTGSCTFVLTDGRRFRCPLSFGNHPQTPALLEHARACRPLTPISIPRSWRPVLTRMYAVQACLTSRGITAHGGPFFERVSVGSPIGELVVFTAERPPTAFIAFYTSARAAGRAEPRVRRNVQRVGGEVARRGLVTVAWTSPPPSALRAAVDACAF